MAIRLICMFQQFLHIRRQFEHIFNHVLCTPLNHQWIDDYIARYEPRKLITVDDLTAEEASQLEYTPTSVQEEALKALDGSRKDGFQRGLIVLATGLGKTWLAAFDSQQCEAKRVLFVAHREEILFQAEETFVRLRPNDRTGFYNGENQNIDCDLLFASVQTLGTQRHLNRLSQITLIILSWMNSTMPAQKLTATFSTTFNPGFYWG